MRVYQFALDFTIKKTFISSKAHSPINISLQYTYKHTLRLPGPDNDDIPSNSTRESQISP